MSKAFSPIQNRELFPVRRSRAKQTPQQKARKAAAKKRQRERTIYERQIEREILKAERRILAGGFPHGAWDLVLSSFQVSLLKALQRAANAKAERSGSGRFRFAGRDYQASLTSFGRVLVSRHGDYPYFLASSDCPCFGCLRY